MREAKLEFAGSVYSIYLGIHQNESIDDYETRLDKEANALLDELILALNNVYKDYDEKLKNNAITYEEYEKIVIKLKEEVDGKFGQLVQDCANDCNAEETKLQEDIANKDYEKYFENEK